MAFWNDQSVAGGDGVAVVNGDGVIIEQDDFGVVRRAEGATGVIKSSHHLLPHIRVGFFSF